MSTRSGKRIHNSFHEDASNNDPELLIKSERKTRSKRNIENNDEACALKSKKRHNYVSYPSQDDVTNDATATDENENKSTHSVRRHTLKELNVPAVEEESGGTKKVVRQTRRTKKFAEIAPEENHVLPETNLSVDNATEVVIITDGKSKGKKNKKKKTKQTNIEPESINKENLVDTEEIKKKKSKRKKNSQSNSLVVDQNNDDTKKNNESNMSVDSFHSAAGSPKNDNAEHSISTKNKELLHSGSDNIIIRETRRKQKSNEKVSTITNDCTPKIGTDVSSNLEDNSDEAVIHSTGKNESLVISTPDSKKKRKSSIKKTSLITSHATSQNISTNMDTTFEREPTDVITKKKTSTFKESNSDIHAQTPLDTTFEKIIIEDDDNEANKKKPMKTSTNLNTTFDKDTSTNTDSSHNKKVSGKQSLTLNGTFEVSPKAEGNKSKLDSTFDKETKLDSTFDKIHSITSKTDSKSSLISSDASSLNVTLDKSNNISSISITSDESKTENLLNTTPLLIESSMEESKILESSIKENKTPESVSKPSANTLKREGTFTKDSSEVSMSPKHTPDKRRSAPSPGRTPFHSNGKGSQTRKSVLNVTHSIEKPTRRSTLGEVVPRTTRVMFCSPVNNPAVVTQRKSKIIKSNLKGSNKSFVYEETEAVPRAARKRSLTQPAEARAKRSRLADDLLQSVERLSRPRTVSATGKLQEATTPSKSATPLKPKSDVKATKLPNFAALHQKRFDRMESLDECQQRKAKRAKRLLEPSGGVAVLERSSPRGTDQKSAKDSPVSKSQASKPITPFQPKLPTLGTLQATSGYTRFGFKLDVGVNPFSIPSKTDVKKPKENKPNGLKREATMPSLAGATAAEVERKKAGLRKQAAKQTIMREKSFTSLADKRSATRSESRTIIKGVRTNRRFELQMKSRNINA